LALRVLLIRGEGRTILVDSGMGDADKADPKQDALFDYRRTGGEGLFGALREAGVEPGEITHVIATHLHFDHAGGLTRRGTDGAFAPAFPGALHYLQYPHWKWAHRPSERDRGSFRERDFAPLAELPPGRLIFLEGPEALFPGLELAVVQGHTVAQQLVKISDGETTLLYAADLCPTRAHLRAPYVMGYDIFPITSAREKGALLSEAARQGWIVAFEHDPDIPAARLRLEGEEAALAEEVFL
jgi:glyoxylase-like metal-dependent hydrolase (beta-lactamase superfamily II)